MKQTTLYRRLLQAPVDEDVMQTTLSPDPNIFQPIINGSSDSTTIRRHFKPHTSPLDSSMAVTILVLLSALSFMGFFSIYIRRLAQEEPAEIRRRTRQPSSAVGLCNNRKGKGLDPSTVQALPLVSYGEDAKQLMITDCPICLSEFEVKEIVKLIPHCKHLFHPRCLDTWLYSHVSCPLCRSTQLFIHHLQDEVCLDVVEEIECSNSTDDHLHERRSTVNRDDTSSEWTPPALRRSCSCTNLGDHVVLQRSMSF